jgi:sec-independent protein translocase protein TatA
MDTIAFLTPGPTEWLLILVIVLVLFGAKKLPELARGLGQGINEFRKARGDFDRSWLRAELPERQSSAPAGGAPAVPTTRGGTGCPEVSAGGVGCNDSNGPTTNRVHESDRDPFTQR